MKKFKTPKTGNRSFVGISPKRLLLVALVVVVLAVALPSCEKQKDCVPGTKKYSTTESPVGPMKASKSDPCEDERNARDSAEYNLNKIYGPDVRNAIDPALYDPNDISGIYWTVFNYNYLHPETLLDSVERHIFTIEYLWENYGNPLPKNDESVKKLYAKCGIYLVGYEDFEKKEAALEDCENNVGIDEYGPTHKCNEKGFWVKTY